MLNNDFDVPQNEWKDHLVQDLISLSLTYKLIYSTIQWIFKIVLYMSNIF